MLKLYFSFHHFSLFFFFALLQACFHGRQKLALLHNHSISQAMGEFLNSYQIIILYLFMAFAFMP